MQTLDVKLSFQGSEDEPSWAVDNSVRELALELRKHGVESENPDAQPRFRTRGFDPSAAFLHEVNLLVTAVTTLGGAAIGAWINSRAGRKVSITIGDIKAEAGSVEALQKILESAQKFKQEHTPSKIIMP